jgi:hypothetical protein
MPRGYKQTGLGRAEHIEWCKRRALEYVDRGHLQGAVFSMINDLRKHRETPFLESTEPVGVDAGGVRRWIGGFR